MSPKRFWKIEADGISSPRISDVVDSPLHSGICMLPHSSKRKKETQKYNNNNNNNYTNYVSTFAHRVKTQMCFISKPAQHVCADLSAGKLAELARGVENIKQALWVCVL